jgi:hypothetical protein
MSRWAEAFAALSGASDTLDTMRHSKVCRSLVSQSVNSVMPAPALSERPPLPASQSVWDETEAERAGIVEHDGAIPRDWAEGFARLDPDRPPADAPPQRWQRFVDDVGRFLESPSVRFQRCQKRPD